MKAALYIRVSTDMQVEDGYSIDGQLAKLKNFADSQDWEVFDAYIDDGYSAKDLKRPAMQKLMDDMKKNLFDVVLVYKLDRLTRSVSDLHKLLKTFDFYNVKFKSSTEVFETTTAMGRFFITLVAAMAEWERETISERVRFGVEQMVREGKRPGGIIPYGYTQEEEPIYEEFAIIRKLRELYFGGDGYKTIAMKLNGQGLLRRGQEWTDATVAYTLENPYYAGTIRIGSKTPEGNYVNSKRDERVNCIYGEGSHIPIFTKEEYRETKELMKRRGRGEGYSKVETYWYSGALRCGRCGAAMFGKLTTKKQRSSGEIVRTPYYICSNRHHKKSCNMPIFRQIHIEHLVKEYIRKIKLENDRLLDFETKDDNDQEKEIGKLKRSLLKISERKEKWKYMFVEELIPQDEFRKHMTDEEKSEQHVRQQIAELENSLSGIPKINNLLKLEDAWNYADDVERKELISTIFDKIVINTDLVNVKGVKNKFFDAYIGDVSYN